MTDLFTNRTPREKLMLAALAGLGLLWLVVTQVWQPLQALRQQITARIPRIERALTEVQANPVPQSTPTLTADPRTTSVILTDAAAAFGLTISRLQPQGAEVLVTLEDAPFDTVLLWTQALIRDDALRLTQLTLTRRPTPGMVATTLTVER